MPRDFDNIIPHGHADGVLTDWEDFYGRRFVRDFRGGDRVLHVGEYEEEEESDDGV